MVGWGSPSALPLTDHFPCSQTIKKTRFPHWDEVLELREMPGAPSPLRVELWDWDMVGKNDFLGMVSLTPCNTLHGSPVPPMGKMRQAESWLPEGWMCSWLIRFSWLGLGDAVPLLYCTGEETEAVRSTGTYPRSQGGPRFLFWDESMTDDCVLALY